MDNPIIVVCTHANTTQFVPESWKALEYANSLRAAKKKMRQAKPALVLLCIDSVDDIALCQSVSQYIREGLANAVSRIAVIHSESEKLDEVEWLEEFQVNACLCARQERALFNQSVLKRELDTFDYIESTYRQHNAETEMLMCISQFSRANETTKELLGTFSQSLAKLCHAAYSCEIYISNDDYRASAATDTPSNMIDAFDSLLTGKSLPNFLLKTIDEQQPQIDLLHATSGIDAILKQSSVVIGSYLAFPIVVYKRVLCLLFFLIPESDMSRVSMRQINIINKASEQLTILLERRKAEYSLKNQYKRLQNALLELKSTKEKLESKEKLASIGRMAAGIAHEINNPLSFVISNFSSMDKYLQSIMTLQSMQSELLTCIDIQQSQEAQKLKESLTSFKQKEGIEFVLEDIRAIVTDSFNGLQRVESIIADLRSFTDIKTSEDDTCDIQKVLNESLKMYKYDEKSTVNIRFDTPSLAPIPFNTGAIEQVINNVVKNAIQAFEGTNIEEPTVTVNAFNESDYFHLIVSDNGPGIDEETKAKMYDPFFTTKPIGQGVGLGLSVTLNIVQKLGGSLSCTTELGRSTEFKISLPLNR
ncbi:sensor histidine kinase [Alteromonas sp. BMJM2]|uniref:sensor histidine kinase n=1 Tax=Alteromonas sp. BMJM2 TaxID=2954241 RepID=UPI0022B406FE|nr:ATP-binding protein [Alteromonas sp. BMJM2]